MLKDFKPALFFLAKFLAFYFIANILYGIYIESCGNSPDAITRQVSVQTATFLNQFDSPVSTEININRPTVFIKNGSKVILSVFEGCNGINVIIVFVAFLFAFSGSIKNMLWFIPVGILIIHIANLLRLSLLYIVAIKYSHYFYYFHKYFFTAILYMIVCSLWALWVLKFSVINKPADGRE